MDLRYILAADHALLAAVRYPWVDIEWRCPLVDLRSPLRYTFGILRSTFRWCRRITASECGCFRLVWLWWT
jgi:hypothetical protein